MNDLSKIVLMFLALLAYFSNGSTGTKNRPLLGSADGTNSRGEPIEDSCEDEVACFVVEKNMARVASTRDVE